LFRQEALKTLLKKASVNFTGAFLKYPKGMDEVYDE
jgi:hypothetical protein